MRKSSPIHYGPMTEEINYCYGGGLYAELVRNRAFKDDGAKPVHWSLLDANGAEPVVGLYAGYNLDKSYIEAGSVLEPYVQ